MKWFIGYVYELSNSSGNVGVPQHIEEKTTRTGTTKNPNVNEREIVAL
jgi:hypothetical protein